MDADVLLEVGLALGALAAVGTREERLGDGVPFDVRVQRVARRERGVAQLALEVADAAVRLDVVLQRRLRLHLMTRPINRIRTGSDVLALESNDKELQKEDQGALL